MVFLLDKSADLLRGVVKAGFTIFAVEMMGYIPQLTAEGENQNREWVSGPPPLWAPRPVRNLIPAAGESQVRSVGKNTRGQVSARVRVPAHICPGCEDLQGVTLDAVYLFSSFSKDRLASPVLQKRKHTI